MSFGEVDRVGEFDHLAQKVRSRAEALNNSRNLLPAGASAPKVVCGCHFAGSFRVFDNPYLRVWVRCLGSVRLLVAHVFKLRFFALFFVFCQARVIASPTASSSALFRMTRVQPERPQAPFSGTNISGCSPRKSCCCSGVSLTIPDFLSSCSVAKILPLARKSGCPM